ncbi:hypothetical protein [Corynebacterium sp. NML130628]|uniref:hypothetical protein n=1 Tax=Corynebacterium sp. NML130628 TaxID=1906333 RepID=UPI0008FB7A7A|nr:hypothetical protein [Corynebacterium sp. NML130628]OIR43979.1 hypothetical protein BJP07_06210 [Corynebacterium sp. NML130628]
MMNSIARKVCVAACVLAVVANGAQVAHAEMAVADSSVTVTADGPGAVFHNSVTQPGRISTLKFTDARSIAGSQESSLYVDLRADGALVDLESAVTVDTHRDGDVQVVTYRGEDQGAGVGVEREFRFEANRVDVIVRVTNTKDSSAFVQADLTNQINSKVALAGSYADGTFVVAPAQLGYATTVSFADATSSGVADAFQRTTAAGEVGFVDPAGASFQRGRWFERIDAGATLTAAMHMEVATQDSAVDSDGDGLPDVWEREGVTLHDGTVMPLDQWGADPERPDLFLQLNWMQSQWQQAGCNTADADADACAQMSVASYRPSRDILQQLVDRFDQYGVNLHIDAGDTYTNIVNYPTRHGGQTEAYTPYYFEGTVPGMKLVENIDTMLGARAAVFRVGVIGDQMQRGHWGTGLALVADNSFYVAKHERMRTEDQLRNTIMHELGHTLGLNHNGSMKFANEVPQSDYLPNYYSVMNYLYQFTHFNYSDEESVSGGPLPEVCNQPGMDCYTGEYRVPADWDNLMINTGKIGKDYTSTIGAAHVKVDAKALDAQQQAMQAAEKAQGSVKVTVADKQQLRRGDNTVSVKVENPGLDAARMRLEVVYPSGKAEQVVTVAGQSATTVQLPVVVGVVKTSSLPLDVRVLNEDGGQAFAGRFDVAAVMDADVDGDAMAGAPRKPQAKTQAAPTASVTPGKHESSQQLTTQRPAPSVEDSNRQDAASKDQIQVEGETNIAAIVAPIVVLLLLIGGGVAAAMAGGLHF